MRKTRLPVVLALAALFLCGAAAAQNDLCVPGVGGLAGIPTIDGVVDGYTGPGSINNDPGWNGAARINLSGDQGATTAAKLQAGFAGDSLYLSYVIDTPSVGPDDTIVIGFSTSAGAGTDWRIHVKPFDVAPPPDGMNIAPFTVIYWRDSSTWNSGGPFTNANGQWPMTNARISRAGTRWALEMRIPVTNNIANAAQATSVYLPASGNFRFYTDVLNTFGFVGMVVQDPWPAGVNVPSGGTLNDSTPPIGMWGTVSFNSRPQCTGVSLAWSDIGVEFPANTNTIVTNIKRSNSVTETTIAQCSALADNVNPGLGGPNNVFIARPVNNMPGTAQQVFATFRLANWGIPGVNNFDLIGAPTGNGVTNHPSPPQNIAGNGGQVSLRSNWALTYKQSCFYKVLAHQCIQVDLDSNDPATRFRNKSVQRNMDFVPASIFQRTALISGDQRGKPGPGETARRFLILVDTDEQVTRGAKPPSETPRRRYNRFRSDELLKLTRKTTGVNQYAWIARGLVLDDGYLTIGKNRYRLGHRAGDFGFVASHSGPMLRWTSVFRGSGMEQVSQGVYMIDVPPGKEAEVLTVIEAVGGREGRKPGTLRPQP